MNELKYNLYFAQLLLNIKEGRDIEKSCEDINEELTTTSNDENKIIFLSQFTNNTIKMFKFDTIQEVEQYIHNLRDWLNKIPCLVSFIDIFQYSLMIQFIIMSKNYYPDINIYCKDEVVNCILDNLDKIYNNLKDKNYKIAFDIEENWYRQDDKLLGNKEFLIQDPDGYLLRFSEDLGDKEIRL